MTRRSVASGLGDRGRGTDIAGSGDAVVVGNNAIFSTIDIGLLLLIVTVRMRIRMHEEDEDEQVEDEDEERVMEVEVESVGVWEGVGDAAAEHDALLEA
ncbi:hypothetical protein FRB98_007818 [Tulasnella sp. 332]|nr:hypothetical protein FRB98_007818 [Tulasnella sp. 332]